MNQNAVTAALVASLLVPSSVAAVGAQNSQAGISDRMTALDEFSRAFRLAPGAHVSVEGIAGPVTVVTGGDSIARVHVIRRAETARELQCYRTHVTGSAARLEIKHVQFSRQPGCNSIRSDQEVRLVVPRSVDLSLSTIAGSVYVGPIDGTLRLDAIAGHVRARGVRSGDLSSLASGLSLTLGSLDQRGVRVSSVVGRTEIYFRPGANADVSVSSVQGNVSSSSSSQPLLWQHGNASVRVGAGGAPVSVSSVIGHVQIYGS